MGEPPFEARYDFVERMTFHVNHVLFALRRSALLSLIALTTAALAACGGAAPPVSGTAVVTNGVATVTSDNMAFNVAIIEAPAGEAFVIRLTNDEDIPHNLSVYTEEGGTLIARGEIIYEGQADEIEVPALEAGEYFFVCDLHVAEMRGTLVVEG
jgi:plastocyanin